MLSDGSFTIVDGRDRLPPVRAFGSEGVHGPVGAGPYRHSERSKL
jgi:hypothetical protein